MRVLKYEFLKLIKFPALWFLIAVFMGVNAVYVYSLVGNDYIRDDIRGMKEIIDRTGVRLSENGGVIDGLMESENLLESMYASYVKAYESKYDDLDMQRVKESKEALYNFHPTGRYKKFIDGNYARWQERLEEIKATGEGDYAFYPGNVFKIHGKLFGMIFRLLLVETMILTAFCVLYIMDFERINKTEGIVFSSNAGREIMTKKLTVGLLTGLVCSGGLMSAALVQFFFYVPMGGLWEVPVSSFMLYETTLSADYPFITVFRVTFAQYLALAVLISLAILLIIGLLAGSLQFFADNSYISALVVATGFLGMLALPFAVKSASFIMTLAAFSPAALWFKSSRWLIENEPSVSFGGWEFYVVVIWGVLALALVQVGKRVFLKKDFLRDN